MFILKGSSVALENCLMTNAARDSWSQDK